MVNLYRLTAFLSASLLFVAQPMFARLVLPLAGGAPAVWNTCQVFFQMALLVGYLYAHASTHWLGTRRQSALHLLLILPPLACLPLSLGATSAPHPEANPSLWLLALMAATIGPPFLALSATAPLVQRWFVSARRGAFHDPYSLYVMSNVGSLAALVGYPFLIEPAATLRQQAIAWGVGYGVWIFCLACCAYFVWRDRPTTAEVPPATSKHDAGAKPDGGKSRPAQTPPPTPAPPASGNPWRRWHWLALSGAPVAWMLGVTTWITTDIAPIPLLWILPLAIYLMTYIVAFSKYGKSATAWTARVLPWVMCALVASLTATGLWSLLLVHVLAFGAGAMVCHGQLAKLRPAEEHLTEFYVWLSFGGALGGTLIAIVAPIVFVVPWEYAVAVAAGCALAPRSEERPNRVIDLVCVLAVLTLLSALRYYAPSVQKPWLLTAALFGFPALALLHYWRRPLAFAALLGVILSIDIREPGGAWVLLRSARSYFGVHRVVAETDILGRNLHELQHGTTAHGIQFRDDTLQCEPLVYYHRTGPLGEIAAAFAPRDGELQHFGAVGLGTGAAACYTNSARDITFFEIDPVVRTMAEDPECFTYLSHCAQGRYAIRLGDGRRMLAQEPEGRFTIILLDAFSSDAIPIHLLTREALQLYMSRTTADGAVAFHVSNNYLDLTPVLADLAHESGWIVRVRRDFQITEAERTEFKATSTYVIIARQIEHLRGLADDPRWRPHGPSGRAPWSDDYANVLSVLQ